MLRKTLLSLVVVSLFLGCKQDDAPTISIDEETVDEVLIIDFKGAILMDSITKLLLYNGTLENLPEKIKFGMDTLLVSNTPSDFIKGKAYTVTFNDQTYQLYKTELPIISVNTDDRDIVDEPKILGGLQLWEKGEKTFESSIGIEIRGGFSQTFPKKSYSVELWEDEAGEESYNESLMGMREDDDWILDGLWNEPLHLRDYVSHDLWLEMGRYPYMEEEPNITFGIKREFCEVFLNGKYRGLYYLGEKVDRKQLGIKSYEDGQLEGEIYKGDQWADGVLFEGLEDFSNDEVFWSGYEAEYPDDVGELDWTNLFDFVGFVVNSEQTTFDQGINDRVSIENMADYFIFMNLIYGADNRGKNIYTGRYDSASPYFNLAWDMDGSFGNDWEGERMDITNIILANGLHAKLLQNADFKAEVTARWSALRLKMLQTPELQKRFTDLYTKLKENGVYEREALDPELPRKYSEEEIDFITSWIQRRADYLDTFFSNL